MNWNDAYVALKRRAEELRGWLELQPPSEGAPRWPRTTGADVVTIVAFLEPYINRLQSSGAIGLARRWEACMTDVWVYGVTSPGDTYEKNRELWACLLALFVHLGSVRVPFPNLALWRALLAELGGVLALRNAGPNGEAPFKPSPEPKTFHDLFLAQWKHLRTLRGFDELAPEANMAGTRMRIPRTTNSDVVDLADYWTKQLRAVRKVVGHESASRRWALALSDVDALARQADPNSVYPKNNRFWRDLSNTAVQVSVADEAPTTWDLAMDALAGSVRELPQNLKAGAEKLATEIGGIAGDVAQGVGKVANEAGRGWFSGFGTPLLIGGGLLGLFLISRARKPTPRERE